MTAKKGRGTSPLATLIQGLGFLVAVILVLHVVFVLVEFPVQDGLAESVRRAAVPLALFFPGLVDAPGRAVQVLLDFGLAAVFWMLLAGVLARIVG